VEGALWVGFLMGLIVFLNKWHLLVKQLICNVPGIIKNGDHNYELPC
jgi:hypothetical protein